MNLSDYIVYGDSAGKLRRAIESSRVSHAYIFEGAYNVDKAGFAKAFAKALLCKNDPANGCDTCPTCRKIDSGNYEDLYWISADGDAGKGNLSIKDEAILELQRKMMLKPTSGERNIAVLHGCDGMTPRAQNRFLKSLEEPSEGTVIMLLSENSKNLLPTINSRCIKYRLTDSGTGGLYDDKLSQMRGHAADIVEMLKDGRYFYDIKSRLDEVLFDKECAYIFLDETERIFGDMLKNGDGFFDTATVMEAVALTEKARNAIRRNVGYRYAVRELILALRTV